MHPADLRPYPLRPVLTALGFDRRAEVTSMASGWSNEVVRVRWAGMGCVARVARRQRGIAGRRAEARIWALASAAGIAPPLLHVDAASGVLVTQDVRARDLDLSSAPPDDAALEAIGLLVGKFHRLPVRQLPISDPRIEIRADLARAAAAGLAIDPLVVRLAGALPELARNVVAHGDLIAANVLFGARPWLVDFETAGWGNADFDLVGLARTLDLDAKRTAALYRGARRAQPGTHRLRELKGLFELREHAWALARLAEGRTEETIARQCDGSLAALRSLSSAP